MLKFKEHQSLYILMLLSLLIRAFAAATVGLGNDEVYYWTYALFPDWSHFDHPPMVGYAIQLFSMNLMLDSELFIRFSSLVFGTLNTYLIYLLTLTVSDRWSAFIAALLYSSSIYCTIIAGIFIMPDGPLMPLWLSCLYLGINLIRPNDRALNKQKVLLLFGLLAGLAVLSKYHALFLWTGLGIFILFHQRELLTKKSLYLSLLLTVMGILPIFIWNLENDFISFRFQGNRVSFLESGLRLDYFGTELAGQVFYNNPFNFLLILLAVSAVFKDGFAKSSYWSKYLIYTALPLIAIVLFFSFFRRTLPHWSGPAYTTLIPVAAVYISQAAKKWQFKLVSWSMGLMIAFLLISLSEIQLGTFSNSMVRQSKDLHQKGKYDITADMFGWNQLAESFDEIVEEDVVKGEMPENAVVIDRRWFTAAHVDYYVAHPMGKRLFVFGSMTDMHKYAWINEYRGISDLETDGYYIAHSRTYSGPEYFLDYFDTVLPSDTFPVIRSEDTIAYFFVYQLKGYKRNFLNPLNELAERH